MGLVTLRALATFGLAVGWTLMPEGADSPVLAPERDEAQAETDIRCRQHPSPAFDRHAEMARRTQGWRYRELDAAHLPFVTVPRELAALPLEVAS